IGDTACLTVKTPILGSAVVTVETDHCLKAWPIELTSATQEIQIPVEAAHTPNVFVSLTIVRGAADCPRKIRDVDFRSGFCELNVADPGTHLVVEPVTDRAVYQPGDQVTASVAVSRLDGEPVRGAEVVLYAVDEGVLSLVQHETPDPRVAFFRPQALGVASGLSLNLQRVRDDHEKIVFGNKGYQIGGGGSSGYGPVVLTPRKRKKFLSTAFWEAGLVTDDEGRVRVSFPPPDNLTEFRLMAVAVKGERLMGAGQHSMRVDKTIVVEPVVPAFAHVGDAIDFQVVAHNGSTERKAFLLRLHTGSDSGLEIDRWSWPVEVDPGKSCSVRVPVRFVEPGRLTLTWRLEDHETGRIYDEVERPLPVGFPMAERQSTAFFRFGPDVSSVDLKTLFHPELLDGKGRFECLVSQSPFLQTAEALSQVLGYPYGCVEQTTSSLLPWIGLGEMKPEQMIEGFSSHRVEEALRRGVDRLLSMQLESGGLGYWPGARQPSLWGSAYGGMGLALARRAGAEVPQPSLDRLAGFLSAQLRGVVHRRASDQRSIVQGLYALSLLGRSEPAYVDRLFAERERLDEHSRLFLALILLEEQSDSERARQLLEMPASGNDRYWLGATKRVALRLILSSRLGQREEAGKWAMKLVELRRKSGERGSTYSNGWAVMAMAAFGNTLARGSQELRTSLQLGDRTRTLRLDPARGTGNWVLPFNRMESTRLSMADGGQESFFACLRLKVQPGPEIGKPVKRGLGVTRRYFRINGAGKREAIEQFQVGDLVEVQLDVSVADYTPYLAVNDPLPGFLEPLQDAFSRRQMKKEPGQSGWVFNHRELRQDRALFFADYGYAGDYRLRYRARVVASGRALAPASRVEAMYDPDVRGTSASTWIVS
ncbi:MAG: alpha-2-macroglobulin family protein, partial [Verrucomicrobiota bacterium]